MRRNQLLLAAAALLLSASAQAQWQWLDSSGRKVYSDQPPPPSVPVKNILKQPRGAATTTSAPAAAQPVAPAASAAPAPGLQLGENDPDLLARKKKAEADAQAKVKAEDQRQAQVKATNCERARTNQAKMDSGVRVSITNDKGEREILDDAARAAEQKKIRTVIETNCK
jgi:type IV secretory pathway VirB10-like protein